MGRLVLEWIYRSGRNPLHRSPQFGSSSGTLWWIAVSLAALLNSGCIAYYGGYGGPVQKIETMNELVLELQSRDLKFNVEFTCPSTTQFTNAQQQSSQLACLRSAAAIRTLMLNLNMLWTDDEASPEPQYKIDIVLADEMSKLSGLSIITALNLWIVIPMYVPMTQHIAAVITEPGRIQQDRKIIKESRRNLAKIDEVRWRPPFSQPIVSSEREIVASAASNYSTLYTMSMVLPTAWLGGRGHREALFMGQPFYFPGISESIREIAPAVLLEVVRQLPRKGKALRKTPASFREP